jgi:hypothetical protein
MNNKTIYRCGLCGSYVDKTGKVIRKTDPDEYLRLKHFFNLKNIKVKCCSES